MNFLQSIAVVGQHQHHRDNHTHSEEDFNNNSATSVMSQVTNQLSSFIVQTNSSVSPLAPSNKYQKTLQCSCQKAEKNYSAVFNSTLEKLKKSDQIVDEFKQIADQMLSDGVINWGRIYVLFTLAGLVARRISESSADSAKVERERKLQEFSHVVADYIKTSAGSWILNQGGWDDMLTHSGDVDDQRPWGTALLTGGLLVGCAALYKVFKS